jgi:hypothetical protein
MSTFGQQIIRERLLNLGRIALEREATDIHRETGWDPRRHFEWNPDWERFCAIGIRGTPFTYPENTGLSRFFTPPGSSFRSSLTPTPEPTPEPVRTVKKPLRYRIRASRRENLRRAIRNADTTVTTRRATYHRGRYQLRPRNNKSS